MRGIYIEGETDSGMEKTYQKNYWLKMVIQKKIEGFL